MARVTLSEYRAKVLLHQFLELPYSGLSYSITEDITKLNNLDTNKKYVVKVDQGVKKRFKRGLIGINKSIDEVRSEIERLKVQGFEHFIVEEFLKYDAQQEQYISIERIREGFQILYSEKGGVQVEDNPELMQRFIVSNREGGGLPLPELTSRILQFVDKYYISFLEINPFLIIGSPSTSSGKIQVLDLAVEVDSAGKFFVHNAWSENDYRFGEHAAKTEEEKNIESLASKSQASFKFSVLNPDGSLWLLLSGGGASIVVADEAHNLGYGKEVANYGEYSGNPNEEETYIYTKNLLSLLLKSSAKNKKLIIAGGVANFTDVAKTFKGVMKAIQEVSKELQSQEVAVFVRRGGPNQIEGLAMMSEFLKKQNLYGDVKGPELVLTDIIKEAI